MVTPATRSCHFLPLYVTTALITSESASMKLTITHQVPNPQNHYIKEVLVTINGKTVNDSFYTSQPAPDTFTYTYPIDTKTTDEITVTASCSLTGSLTRTLYNTGTIATTPPGATADPAPTRADAGLLPLLGLAIYIGYRKG